MLGDPQIMALGIDSLRFTTLNPETEKLHKSSLPQEKRPIASLKNTKKPKNCTETAI